MSRRPPSWFDLTANMMRLAVESQGVVALRMMKLASGDADVGREFNLMFAEKAQAAIDAHMEAGVTALAGRPDLAPARALALYRRRVRANHRRLSRRT